MRTLSVDVVVDAGGAVAGLGYDLMPQHARLVA